MLEAIIAGLGGLVIGFNMLVVNWQSLIMLGRRRRPAVPRDQEGLRAPPAGSDRVRLHPGQHPPFGCHEPRRGSSGPSMTPASTRNSSRC